MRRLRVARPNLLCEPIACSATRTQPGYLARRAAFSRAHRAYPSAIASRVSQRSNAVANSASNCLQLAWAAAIFSPACW